MLHINLSRTVFIAATILGGILLSSCGSSEQKESTQTLIFPIVEQSGADQALKALLNDHWQWTLSQAPLFATTVGVRDYDSQLPDISLENYYRQIDDEKHFLARLNEIETDRLSKSNQLNQKLLRLELESSIDASEFGGKFLIMNNRSGPHLSMTRMPSQLPFFTEADYRSYLQRLKGVPEYMAQATARIKAGLDAEWVQPCAPMQGFEHSISTHIVSDLDDSAFLTPFESKPAIIDQTLFDQLEADARMIVRDSIIPAFRGFNDFYLAEYAPSCRETVGTDSMPGGKAYYQHRVKHFTTTDLTVDEIHQLGLSEVDRIRAEMDEVIQEANFEGSFAEWLQYLKSEPKFYPKTAEERMNMVAAISKKIDGELPKLFKTLPRMPYGLKEIPADIAEKTTTAYYQPPAGDGSRAGFYFVNTSLLETRPLYQLEALSLHEAVPGHHLQIALAQELDLPEFRRFGGQTVFIEGWGLYAERLGLEVGFYETPYTNFGRLSYEMWRACRLVVDTGIHSKGWTRQQAIDYMMENSGLSQNNVISEVDRYISWPGQALAYKIGELKIRELRTKTELALGSEFDIREFHDRILENGALPLSVLEQIINDWLSSK